MNTQEFKAFEKFIDLMYEFSRKMHPYDTTARQYGTEDMLYMTEVHTVRSIGREPKITITEIAEKSNRTKSAVSQMIDKLKEKGILDKVRDPEDQRRFILRLTDKGQIIYDFHESLDKKNYEKMLEGMEGIDLEDIGTGTRLLSEILKTSFE